MKISEYIDSCDYLQVNNVIKHTLMDEQMTNPLGFKKIEHLVWFTISEDFLEFEDIERWFSLQKNKVILLNNVDIDFPPPKKPWRYDKYFHKHPSTGREVCYEDKIHFSLIEIIEKNNLYVVSCSVSIHHPRILNLPIGIFHKLQPSYFRFKTQEKKYTCYANFGIPCDRWHGNPRKDILSLIDNKPFIYKEKNKSQEEFYQTIAQSKFTLCPRGCGIDTYRLWDTICLGSIPIVEKTDGHENWQDLPIYFLNNRNDIAHLTEEDLEQKYEEMKNKDYCYDKMKWDYWKETIQDIEKTLLQTMV